MLPVGYCCAVLELSVRQVAVVLFHLEIDSYLLAVWSEGFEPPLEWIVVHLLLSHFW